MDMLKAAFDLANDQCGDGPASQRLHAERSKRWVSCLARKLGGDPPAPDVRILSKYDPSNSDDFGLNELLYDICIVETDTCPSARNRKQLRYVTRALWQVESEFARDSFEAVKDFNKLVIGSAENKLFIGPCLSERTASTYREALLPVAKRVEGVYLAHVPHPSDWRNDCSELTLWQMRQGKWDQLS